MCNKGKNCGCCNCGNNDSSSQTNNSTENKVENVYNTLPGHPIIMIDDPSDLALFNVSTGKGSGIWEGWALMDGKTHKDVNNGNSDVDCHNMMDRCPVMAGNSYAVGDDFGVDSVSLTAAQNGAHNHTITDPGHSHAVIDPGHGHALTDPGHSHALTDGGHTHGVTNTMALSKNIASASHVESAVDCTTGAGADVPDTWMDQTIDLTGSVTVNNATTGITMGSSSTGATVNNANTGLTVNNANTGLSLANSGLGEAHENRQPSYALYFIKRIYVPA